MSLRFDQLANSNFTVGHAFREVSTQVDGAIRGMEQATRQALQDNCPGQVTMRLPNTAYSVSRLGWQESDGFRARRTIFFEDVAPNAKVVEVKRYLVALSVHGMNKDSLPMQLAAHRDAESRADYVFASTPDGSIGWRIGRLGASDCEDVEVEGASLWRPDTPLEDLPDPDQQRLSRVVQVLQERSDLVGFELMFALPSAS
jgi:hypothetical protein